MKQLHLYGYRANEDPKKSTYIADVFVRNRRVVVEAKTSQLERELTKAIEPGAYGSGYRIAPTLEAAGTYHDVNDPRFLEALRYATGLWIQTYDGWSIPIMRSKIIEA